MTEVEAATAEEAQKLALEMPDEDRQWEILSSKLYAVEVEPELSWVTLTPREEASDGS